MPNVAQPDVLHAHARGMIMRLGSGQRAATVGAPVSVMQRQIASYGMHGLQRRMCTGESVVKRSAQIWFSASQFLKTQSDLAHALSLHMPQ